MKHLIALTLVLAAVSPVAAASIEDLSEWTLLEDPPHLGMTALLGNAGTTFGAISPLNSPKTHAFLRAFGAIPSGTDIGYASVNGVDVASSTAGYYFNPASDFTVAIDFNFGAQSSVGVGGIGFGIGEDINGADSAGAGMVFINGAPILFATAGRSNDVDLPIESIVGGFAVGRFFVEYDSVTGDVTVGVNATPGTTAPSVFKTLAGIQNQWDNDPLLVSFFLRSQAASPLPALTSGQVDAYFSNFEVLSGTPISIPEPSTTALAALALLASASRKRGRRRRQR